MTASLTDVLKDLTQAEAYEQERITGYVVILSFPPNLLSVLSHDEVTEALQWSRDRLAKISAGLAAVKVLLAHGYPAREQQLAPPEVLEELRLRLLAMQLAIAEFAPPQNGAQTGSAEIGAEVPIEDL